MLHIWSSSSSSASRNKAVTKRSRYDHFLPNRASSAARMAAIPFLSPVSVTLTTLAILKRSLQVVHVSHCNWTPMRSSYSHAIAQYKSANEGS